MYTDFVVYFSCVHVLFTPSVLHASTDQVRRPPFLTQRALHPSVFCCGTLWPAGSGGEGSAGAAKPQHRVAIGELLLSLSHFAQKSSGRDEIVHARIRARNNVSWVKRYSIRQAGSTITSAPPMSGLLQSMANGPFTVGPSPALLIS